VEERQAIDLTPYVPDPSSWPEGAQAIRVHLGGSAYPGLPENYDQTITREEAEYLWGRRKVPNPDFLEITDDLPEGWTVQRIEEESGVGTVEKLKPRSDVGSGGLAGALAWIFMLILDRSLFDFNLLVGALTVVFVFAGGYIPTAYKSLWTATLAFVAIIVSSGVGYFLGYPLDEFLVSSALAGLTVALVTYFGRPNDPDTPVATGTRPAA
jgi:hypothetical protein